MSMIHSSCVPLGFKATVRWGTARFRTVRSMTVIMQGSARTATPSQARREPVGVLMLRHRTSAPRIDNRRARVLMTGGKGDGCRRRTTEFAAVEIPIRLDDLLFGVHHDWAVSNYLLADWLASNDQDPWRG